MNLLLDRKYLLFLLLGIIFLLNVIGLYHKGLTYDEGRHYEYGTNILSLNSDRFDDSKMPFSALNAVPRKLWTFVEHLPFSRVFRTLEKMRTGRYITIFFSILIGYFVYRWARELYGNHAAFFALLFYAFCPNMLAHSRLITTDIYATGMILFSLYFYWRFLNEGGWRNGLLSATMLGLSQLAKYTCVFLYPMFILILILNKLPLMIETIRSKDWGLAFRQIGTFFKFTLLFIVVSLFLINLGFLFNKSFTRFGDYEFKSTFLKNLQSNHQVLKQLPVPVPYPYLEGLDWVKYNEETGSGYGLVYLLGETKRGEGFTGYYFYAFLYKVPLAVQILFLIALVRYFWKWNTLNFLRNEIFLLIPITFFAIYFNYFYKADIGMRFFIVILPLLYIFTGNLFQSWQSLAAKIKFCYGLLAVYYVGSVLSYTPHYLSYFNELVWDRKQAYKVLADSNIDWGENNWYLEKYKKKHPEAIVSPEAPVPGRIVVTVNELTGVTADPKKFEWLRKGFQPVNHIAYSYLVYDIKSVPPLSPPRRRGANLTENGFPLTRE